MEPISTLDTLAQSVNGMWTLRGPYKGDGCYVASVRYLGKTGYPTSLVATGSSVEEAVEKLELGWNPL